MKELLNRKQLAEHYSVSYSTIQKWKLRGLPCIALSTGRVMYDLDKVEAWLLGKEVE